MVKIMLGAATASPVYIMVLAARHSTSATFFFFTIRMKEAHTETGERDRVWFENA